MNRGAPVPSRTSESRANTAYRERVDVEETHLYVLNAHDEHGQLRGLIAGGIRHRSLRWVSDENRPARIIVRSITDTIPLELRHSSMAPFLVEVK